MAALTALDQWTKALAVRYLMNQTPVVLMEGVFQLHYSEIGEQPLAFVQGKLVSFSF